MMNYWPSIHHDFFLSRYLDRSTSPCIQHINSVAWASELYRLIDCRLPAKLVPIFADLREKTRNPRKNVRICEHRWFLTNNYVIYQSRKQILRPQGISRADYATPLYQQKLAVTSPTSGGRLVGIVRLRTQVTELYFVFSYVFSHIYWVYGVLLLLVCSC
jgi:hypothetical protein